MEKVEDNVIDAEWGEETHLSPVTLAIGSTNEFHETRHAKSVYEKLRRAIRVMFLAVVYKVLRHQS